MYIFINAVTGTIMRHTRILFKKYSLYALKLGIAESTDEVFLPASGTQGRHSNYHSMFDWMGKNGE